MKLISQWYLGYMSKTFPLRVTTSSNAVFCSKKSGWLARGLRAQQEVDGYWTLYWLQSKLNFPSGHKARSSSTTFMPFAFPRSCSSGWSAGNAIFCTTLRRSWSKNSPLSIDFAFFRLASNSYNQQQIGEHLATSCDLTTGRKQKGRRHRDEGGDV